MLRYDIHTGHVIYDIRTYLHTYIPLQQQSRLRKIMG
jgi:hypothetical protein